MLYPECFVCREEIGLAIKVWRFRQKHGDIGFIARSPQVTPVSRLVPEAPARPTPPDLLIRSHITSWSGYGQLSIWLGRSLEPLGVSVGYLPINSDRRYGLEHPWVAARRVTAFEARKCRLQASVPNHRANGGTDAVFTMWESSRLSDIAVKLLNRVPRVMVPCEWNAETFAASGVTSQIDVVPLGYDPAEFSPAPFRTGGPFVVGLAGRVAHGGARKGMAEGIAAFLAAFPGRSDVRIEVKVMRDDVRRLPARTDSRVVVVSDAFTRAELERWYAGLDVLLVPAKAEGFGLHTLEAMAIGRPVIAAPVTGTADIWADGIGWALDGQWEPAGAFYAGLGDWFVPSHDAMVEALREAHASPDEVRRRGATAAERAAEFTWWETGKRLNEVLNLGGRRQLFAPYAGPLPNCVHAAYGLALACNPIRCHAYHGSSCGGSHSTPEHCSTCTFRSPRP